MKLIVKAVLVVTVFVFPQTAFALSVQDSLGDWRNRYSSSDKDKVSSAIVRAVHQQGLTVEDMRICISSTAGNGGLDHMKISEVGAACAIMLE